MLIKKKRKAFTLLEIMIAIGISSLIMISMAGLQFISGRSIKNVYGQTRTRSSRNISIDQVKYKLMDAKKGTVQITNGNHKIEYLNPNSSELENFLFNDTTNTLYFNGVPVVSGPIDITFEQENLNTLKINVKTSSGINLGDVDLQDGEISITLRN